MKNFARLAPSIGAAAVSLALLVLAGAPGAFASEPSWKVLRVGVGVYIGNDYVDETSATICPSVRTYTNFIKHGAKQGCWASPMGTPAHVLSVAGLIPWSSSAMTRIVLIRADSGAWQGYTGTLLALQPRVPVGTVLKEADKLYSTQTSDDGPTLPDETQVVVLKFNAHTRSHNVFVRVISGPHAGAKGWMSYWNVFPPIPSSSSPQ